MYLCQLCGTQVPPRVACHRVVVETRSKTYAQRERIYLRRDRDGKIKWFPDPGGDGREYAREVRACFDCSRIFS